MLRFLFLSAWLATVSHFAVGQQGASPVSTLQKLSCHHPANPYRRQCTCNDETFGWDEALAGDWSHLRRAMQRFGITPTASYVGALQTNPTGGHDQVWSYAGQLSFAVTADFGEILKVPGLSAYVGASWGTGSNLSSSVNSVIPTSGLYAPSFYLGEMYLQQKLAQRKLAILAGRLAAGNSFAALPVFASYVNYGINPNPYSIGANDVTFFGPPTGTEWGAQATYAVTPALRLRQAPSTPICIQPTARTTAQTSLSRKGTKVSLRSVRLTTYVIRQQVPLANLDRSQSAFWEATIRCHLSPTRPTRGMVIAARISWASKWCFALMAVAQRAEPQCGDCGHTTRMAWSAPSHCFGVLA
jgi:hypothetical protein